MEMGREIVVFGEGAAAAPPLMGPPPPTCLAPGFRFHPTDEELVRYYLRRKVCGKAFRFEAVTEIDVYKSEPWQLADHSALNTRDLEWYFFSPVDKKYGNGSRLNRATDQGYWKATGKDRPVRHKNVSIGSKKTLVFHSGRAPDGKRTNWVMHEYRLADPELENTGISQDAFVLCRIFQKSGLGPPSGDRYAPFVEEEWDEEAPLLIPGGDVDDDVANVDELRGECSNIDRPLSLSPPTVVYEAGPSRNPFSGRPGSAAKRPKLHDPNSSNANGSEDSTTTSHDPSTSSMTTKTNPRSLEFPLIETVGAKEKLPLKAFSFDSANLESSLPPSYLKLIENLESEIVNISMEKEGLKIEMLRAQAMMDALQSRVEELRRENEEFRRRRA